ncbi:MAG: Veg family protein [Bacilli bacterium]|nr:Veg family protein [Bacilli bacterium]
MNIKNIRNYLKTKIGSSIVVMYYGSRNRKEVYRGVLCKLYTNIFTIRLYNGEVKSFSYIDVLTKTIQICI